MQLPDNTMEKMERCMVRQQHSKIQPPTHTKGQTHTVFHSKIMWACVCVYVREREHDRDPVFSVSTIILISLITINPDYQSNQLK